LTKAALDYLLSSLVSTDENAQQFLDLLNKTTSYSMPPSNLALSYAASLLLFHASFTCAHARLCVCGLVVPVFLPVNSAVP